MKSIFFPRTVILFLLILSACGEKQILTTQVNSTPTPTLGVIPLETAQVITPENVGQLTQIQQMGMGEAIGSPIFSPDGKWLYQATSSGVFAFDTASYETSRLVAPYSTLISDQPLIDLSPDGKTLAVGNDLVLAETGQKMSGLDIPWPGTETVKFSPDGTLLAREYDINTIGSEARVGVWRVADGSLLQTFPANRLKLAELGFSTDGNFLSVPGFSKNSFPDLYDIRIGKQLSNWTGRQAVFLTGNQLCVESSDDTIRIYNLVTGVAEHAFYGKFVGASPDGTLIALLSFDQLKIYRISDEQLVGTIDAHSINKLGYILRFSSDGQTLAVYSADYCCGGISSQSLSLWRVAEGTLIKRIDQPSNLFTFSPDGKSLAVTIWNGSTQIINTADGSLKTSVGAYNLLASSLAFLPDGKHLAVVGVADNNDHHTGYEPPLYFYEVESGTLTGHEAANAQNAQFFFGADGKVYPSGELTGRPFAGWEYGGCVTTLSADGKKVATSHSNTNGSTYGFEIRNVPEETLLVIVSGPPAEACSPSFSPDGQHLAVAFQGDTFTGDYPFVQVWGAVPNGKKIMELYAPGGVSMVNYSPDGRMIAAGGFQGVVVWNAADGTIRFTIDAHVLDLLSSGLELVQRLAFSPDGRILAFGTAGGLLELWDTQKGEEIYSAQIAYGPISICDVDFSPDGRLLAVGSEDGGVRIFGIK